MTCVKPLKTSFQTVSCWSSVSGSGRTHQLRAGTHANRHDQQVTTLVLHKRLAAVLGVTRREIALINGESRPTEEFSTGISPALAGGHKTLDAVIADFNRANEDLYAILYLLTEKACGTPRGQA